MIELGSTRSKMYANSTMKRIDIRELMPLSLSGNERDNGNHNR